MRYGIFIFRIEMLYLDPALTDASLTNAADTVQQVSLLIRIGCLHYSSPVAVIVLEFTLKWLCTT